MTDAMRWNRRTMLKAAPAVAGLDLSVAKGELTALLDPGRATTVREAA